MRPPLLEVVCLHAADAEAAESGGADRLLLIGEPTGGGHSPDPQTVGAVRRATGLPVRVLLRLSAGYATTGAEVSRLRGLAADYLAVGADGLVLGFLTADLDVDVEVTATVLAGLEDVPWTFHRAVDAALDAGRAWRDLRSLPGLDAVLTAGSVRGLTHGLDDLVSRARVEPGLAALVLAGGGLAAEHVPWLLQAGVRAFHVASGARPGGSWARASVDAGFVRSWRLVLDDEAVRMASTTPR